MPRNSQVSPIEDPLSVTQTVETLKEELRLLCKILLAPLLHVKAIPLNQPIHVLRLNISVDIEQDLPLKHVLLLMFGYHGLRRTERIIVVGELVVFILQVYVRNIVSEQVRHY